MSSTMMKRAVLQLLAQYKEVMKGRDMEAVMNDPIVSINTRVCQQLLEARTNQKALGLLEMAASDALAEELKMQTLWLVVYLFTLKDHGVSVVVQHLPPVDPLVEPKVQKRMAMEFSSSLSFWSYESKDTIRPKQPLVRLVPMKSGLYVELRKITQNDGVTLRSVHKESWNMTSEVMHKPVDIATVKTKLRDNGFSLKPRLVA